jgi:hypothetical protein
MHDLDLLDRRPRHRDIADVVVLEMDENALDMIDLQ